ncbi:MAG: replicative DNA helicase [Solirubrobacterales bacterium]
MDGPRTDARAIAREEKLANNGQASGIVPPQNLEAEESVLGAMMVSAATIEPVVLDAHLQADDFYRDRHRTIYAAIVRLHEDGEPVDPLTVSEALSQHGELDRVGGRDGVHGLAAKVGAPGSAKHYAQIVKQNSLMRRLDAAAKQIQQSVAGREGDASEIVEQAERVLFQVAHQERAADFREIGAILAEEIDKLEALAKGDAEVTGTASGFRDIDQLTGGFQPNNLIVIAARPSMGKSAAMCNIAENVAVKHNKPVALFSLEMSEMELSHRFIASQARISGDRLRKGQVSSKDWPKVVKACNILESAPLWIDASADLGLLELRAKARRLHAQERPRGGLGLVVVDYIQLMRADDPRANRVEQVGQFSRGLKILAGELDVPVIALSQLSRAPELRPDKRPILSDLRESGCLTGDSLVYLPTEGRRVPIRDLVGKSGFEVLAVNPETWRMEPRRVERAFATGYKRTFRLRTRLGRTIRASENHRFLTVGGWRRLDELKRGGHLALPRMLPGPAKASMTNDEIALLGLLIGDGCTLPTHAIQFTAQDRSIANRAAELATSVFGSRVKPRIKPERSWYQVYLPANFRLTHGKRNPVAEWLDGLGAFGLRSYEKRVPAQVFAQTETAIACFLRHLWATDGCIWHGRGRNRICNIYYASSSEGLARDVQTLLLRLGINARVHSPRSHRGRPQHHVTISGAADQAEFLERVGGLGRQKERDAARILRVIGGRAANTNRDVIPKSVWRSLVEPARIASGLTHRKMQSAIGVSYCGSTLEKANLSRERAGRVAGVVESTELRHLARSEVYWDQVASIEEDAVEEVYDLTVEGLHNFVADNVIVHNSIEQDADVVAFIYRDDYYKGDESEEPGVAEIIFAKHRNGPIGTKKLAFIAHYPRFSDLSLKEQPVEQPAGAAPPVDGGTGAGDDPFGGEPPFEAAEEG